jgi:hypothetical protein
LRAAPLPRRSRVYVVCDGRRWQRVVVFLYAVFAIVVLLASWAVHGRIKPYFFAFQNAVEHLLFSCDVAAVALGVVYTELLNVGMSADVKHLLEGLLIIAFGGSTVVAAVWLAAGYARGRLNESQEHLDERHKQEHLEMRARRSSESHILSFVVPRSWWKGRRLLDDETKPRLTFIASRDSLSAASASADVVADSSKSCVA